MGSRTQGGGITGFPGGSAIGFSLQLLSFFWSVKSALELSLYEDERYLVS